MNSAVICWKSAPKPPDAKWRRRLSRARRLDWGAAKAGGEGSSRELAAVRLHHVAAHHFRARPGRKLMREFLDLFDVIADVIGMREIRRPEKFVGAAQLDHRGQRALVGVRRNPAVALEVKAWLLLERHGAAHEARVHRVEPIEPIGNPTRARFQQNELEFREFVEGAVLKKAGKRVANRVSRGHVQEVELPARVLTIVAAG